MGFFISGGIALLLAVIFLGVGAYLRKSADYFEEHKLSGVAEVAGYDHGEKSTYYTLLVSLPALNDDNLYNCASGPIDPEDYPVGSQVNVYYAAKKTLGIPVVEVHLANDPPSNDAVSGGAMKWIGIILLAVALCLAAAGLIFGRAG